MLGMIQKIIKSNQISIHSTVRLVKLNQSVLEFGAKRRHKKKHKQKIVIFYKQGSHSPEKSGKVWEFFWSGKVWEKSGNFVGSQGKLAMIIHVARVLVLL